MKQNTPEREPQSGSRRRLASSGLKKKFDAVIGAPPYQKSPNSGNEIWSSFVQEAYDLCKPGGRIAFIHPPGWRGDGRTNNRHLKNVRAIMREIDVLWLKMHSKSDGKKLMRTNIPFDMVVSRKTRTPSHETEIVDIRNKTARACIKEMSIIPSGGFCKNEDKIVAQDLIAKNKEETAEVIKNSFYRKGKSHMSVKRTKSHRHPCVCSIAWDGQPNCIWSSKRECHFGIPKVIFCTWNKAGIPYLDLKGEYGLSDQAAAVVDHPKNLPLIAKAMRSPHFREVMETVQFGTNEWNYQAIRKFRKDFWKSFL